MDGRFKRGKAMPGALALLAVLVASASDAGVGLDLSIGTVQGPGWRAEGVTARLELRPARSFPATVTATRLELPEPIGVVEDFTGHCGLVELEGALVRCRGLEVSAAGRAMPRMEGEITFDRRDRSLAWDLSTADGMTISGHFVGEGWRATLRAEAWPLEAVPAWVPGLAAAGTLDGTIELAGGDGGPAHVDFDVNLRGLAASSEDGTSAVEGVELEATGSVRFGDQASVFQAKLSAGSGEVYQEPVYADLTRYPATLALEGRREGRILELSATDFTQRNVVSGRGRAWLEATEEGWRLAAGLVDIDEAILPGAYTVLLQPFLADTDLANLQTRGRFSAEARLADGRLRYLSMRLDGVDLDDQGQRLAAYGVDGDLSWAPRAADVPTRPVRLAWKGGFLYGIPIGGARLEFEAGPAGWTLQGPVRIPVLDGALAIRTWSMGDFTQGNARVVFDAELEPVGMRALARALDWPPMSGTLSGRLPELTYENGDLQFGGVLEATVFDGRVRVSDFSLREPFQPGSLLQAELELQGLDLEQLTEAFSFGRITGTLDGYVRDLEMLDWSAVTFDARLYTPEDDPRSHRISQRAVDNIASLGGGGGAAALSKGFLKFFEEFRYDRMALGCRLEGEVCRMSGVKPAETGYYILTGSGLPRIEVIGFADRVSWPTLVEQLKAIVESEGPVVR